ncbi:hypothetical protein LY90DRAFT_505823 [Neocallimastix californiae]|uniref:Uncharacterized protein n=1 Tax=Neocallimastix californiae TaxID=1754190 RepID=A0A1Y2DNS5_9FUNG|nr:hypothetical protein LY90DRAFT_505823 [Neocallimastix californiae]|eukprot:ORY60305.1 hypothetical protein LY90DRAFT_505823 [Neocallimastix californiae]
MYYKNLDITNYHKEDIINAIEKNESKKQYNDHNSHQFFVTFLIDIYHISNYDMKIGNDIIQGFKNDIKKYFECATLTLLEAYLFKTNTNIMNLKKKLTLYIRFKNIPSTDISVISNLKNIIWKPLFQSLSIIHENSFYNIKGIITALYLPEYFVNYYTFICDNPSCKRYNEKKMLHQNYNYSYTSNGIEVLPNAVDKKFIENNICTYCKRHRKEIVEERIGTLIQKGMLSVLEKNGCYYNTCTIFIEAPKLFYNDYYIKISTLKTNQELVEHHINQSYIPKSISFFLKYPKLSFHYLIEWEKNSYQFTSEKIHLMFVLDDYQPLFLRLIEGAQKMRRNHEMFKENNKYRPLIEISTTTDKNINVPSFIGGGDLCYAKDGVLKVPFSFLTPKEVKHVISVNNNNISIPLQGNQIECFVPLVNTTIIWGLYDIQYLNIKNKKGKSTIKYIKDLILKDTDALSINFSNFNLYSYMRTVPNEKIDKLICEDIIEPLCYMEKDNDGNDEENIKIPDITREDFIFFINTVSNIDVKISEDCNKLIQEYCHIYRTKIKLTIELSSIVHMYQLCFRNIAIVDDALVAIIIYEESVAALEKSSSLLSFKSLPNDLDNFSSYGTLKIEERISCYKKIILI